MVLHANLRAASGAGMCGKRRRRPGRIGSGGDVTDRRACTRSQSSVLHGFLARFYNLFLHGVLAGFYWLAAVTVTSMLDTRLNLVRDGLANGSNGSLAVANEVAPAHGFHHFYGDVAGVEAKLMLKKVKMNQDEKLENLPELPVIKFEEAKLRKARRSNSLNDYLEKKMNARKMNTQNENVLQLLGDQKMNLMEKITSDNDAASDLTKRRTLSQGRKELVADSQERKDLEKFLEQEWQPVRSSSGSDRAVLTQLDTDTVFNRAGQSEHCKGMLEDKQSDDESKKKEWRGVANILDMLRLRETTEKFQQLSIGAEEQAEQTHKSTPSSVFTEIPRGLAVPVEEQNLQQATGNRTQMPMMPFSDNTHDNDYCNFQFNGNIGNQEKVRVNQDEQLLLQPRVYGKYKQDHDFESRKAESERLMATWPEQVPVVVERRASSKLPDFDKNGYLVPRYVYVHRVIRTGLNRLGLGEGDPLYLLVNNKYVLSEDDDIKDVYDSHKDADGFLYIAYTEEEITGMEKVKVQGGFTVEEEEKIQPAKFNVNDNLNDSSQSMIQGRRSTGKSVSLATAARSSSGKTENIRKNNCLSSESGMSNSTVTYAKSKLTDEKSEKKVERRRLLELELEEGERELERLALSSHSGQDEGLPYEEFYIREKCRLLHHALQRLQLEESREPERSKRESSFGSQVEEPPQEQQDPQFRFGDGSDCNLALTQELQNLERQSRLREDASALGESSEEHVRTSTYYARCENCTNPRFSSQSQGQSQERPRKAQTIVESVQRESDCQQALSRSKTDGKKNPFYADPFYADCMNMDYAICQVRQQRCARELFRKRLEERRFAGEEGRFSEWVQPEEIDTVISEYLDPDSSFVKNLFPTREWKLMPCGHHEHWWRKTDGEGEGYCLFCGKNPATQDRGNEHGDTPEGFGTESRTRIRSNERLVHEESDKLPPQGRKSENSDLGDLVEAVALNDSDFHRMRNAFGKGKPQAVRELQTLFSKLQISKEGTEKKLKELASKRLGIQEKDMEVGPSLEALQKKSRRCCHGGARAWLKRSWGRIFLLAAYPLLLSLFPQEKSRMRIGQINDLLLLVVF